MNPYTINPPDSEVSFEQLCLALLKRHWKRPGLERFGKKGEKQYGVDILDTFAESPMYAAQCKLKEAWKSLDAQEIRAEVTKAEGFPGKLEHYAILTTGKISGTAQLAIQQINQDHRASGAFTVELFTWEKITDLLRQYPEIEQQFYGGFRSEEVQGFQVKLEAIHSGIEAIGQTTGAASTTEIDLLIDEARDRIKPGEAQIALMLLHRIQRLKGEHLSDWHRFRIYTNLGAANLILGNGTEAARNFLDAAPLRPEDELAVTNEILAHYLLEDQTIREKTEAAAIRFPNAARIRSLLIQSAKIDTAYANLLAETPAHMRSDAEVASALGHRAMMAGLADEAIEHAEAAIADKPKWAHAHLLLAQFHFAWVVVMERRDKLLTAEERDRHLQNAISAANTAITNADSDDQAYIRAQAFALKTDVALLQGRKDDAAQFARDSFAADPLEVQSLMAMAHSAFSRNDGDEAIRILEQAYIHSKHAANVCYMLGQALMRRGKEEDISRAFEVFGSASISSIPQELIDPLTVGAIRALARSGRCTEVPKYLERREVKQLAMLNAAVQAYAAQKQSQEVLASQKLDEALASRRPADTNAAIYFLADTLLEAGRLKEALPLLQHLFRVRASNFDVGLLFNCAGRLGEHRVILQTCQELHDRGIRNWEIQEFESQYLELYDPEKAIIRLQEFARDFPEQPIAKLRLAIVAMRFGKADLVELDDNTMPRPETLPMRYAIAAIQALQWQNRETLAVDYAYRLLRVHSEEIDAHKAFLYSMSPGVRPDISATMDQVLIGSAVQYTEAGASESEWVVIENTDNPNPAFEEIPAEGELAKRLFGKRVGETFVLAENPMKDRTATINQILSKYVRRFQVIGEMMEIKFGSQSVVWTMRLPNSDAITAADLQPILDSVKCRSEAATNLLEFYKENPLSIHMYGDQLGENAYEGIIHLAVSETGFVRCAHPQMDFFANAVKGLSTKSSIVLDLTALATLRLLDVTRQILTCGVARFILTPATFTELQRLRAKSRFSTAHDTLYYESGQHYRTETTQEQADKQNAAFQEWMQTIEDNTTVVAVNELANLDSAHRELHTKFFGRDGLEAAVLALSPGSILWTDDLALAEIGRTEMGSERVWSQVVLESLAERGLIDRALADECHAKLLGFGYQSTHFSGATIAAALRVSNGSIDGFPMKQAVAAFRECVINNRVISFRQLAEFVLRLSTEPMLPETKCLALTCLLDAFPSDPTTAAQLDSFRLQCAMLMELNPFEQQRFLACFDRWCKRKDHLILPS